LILKELSFDSPLPLVLIMANIDLISGARALITGGAGFIGSHVADLLVCAGASEVIVFDNLSRGRLANLASARSHGRITFVEGDIRDRAALAQAVMGVDVLFHLAAIRLTQCVKEPRMALEVMADGTFNVLETAVAARTTRVIAASSASIYGMADRFPTSEEHHPYRNTTLYGAAKMFNEGLLASFREMYGLDYVALRPFNVYGPRMDVDGAYTEVFIRWMDRIARGLPPVIWGDGAQSMDFIFVEDAARAFVLAANADAPGEVFNVASGVETSLSQLARTLVAVMGADSEIEYGPERKLTAVPRRLADTSSARARLGFEARVGLQEGLQRLVSWWRDETAASRATGV
jgi:UDP-glucose 4-epimerase